MRKYIIDEPTLFKFLVSEMWLDCLDRDGVDNWVGYGESYLNIMKDYTPKGAVLPEEAGFDDVALARLRSGEFEEYKP